MMEWLLRPWTLSEAFLAFIAVYVFFGGYYSTKIAGQILEAIKDLRMSLIESDKGIGQSKATIDIIDHRLSLCEQHLRQISEPFRAQKIVNLVRDAFKADVARGPDTQNKDS